MKVLKSCAFQIVVVGWCLCVKRNLCLSLHLYILGKNHMKMCVYEHCFLFKFSMLVLSNIIVVQIWCMLTDCGNYSLCFSFGFGGNKCFLYTVESPFKVVLSLVFKASATQTSFICVFHCALDEHCGKRQVQVQQYFVYMNLNVLEKTWKSIVSMYNLCNAFVVVDRM